MAETLKSVNKIKKKGLPPLSPHSEVDGDVEGKPARRRTKKKTIQATETNGNVADVKTNQEANPIAKKRKKREPSQNRESEAEPPAEPLGDGDAPVTPKKKKKKKPKVTEDGTDVNEGTQNQDGESGKKKGGQGSKTSLLSKEGETPRKKVAKKKKKVKKSPAADDEYGENMWAEDLRTLADDILQSPRETGGKEQEMDDEEDNDHAIKQMKLKTTFLTGPMLKSQPLDKIFVESSRKFKGLNKSTLNKQIAEETVKADITPVVTRKTTIDFALSSHMIFRVVSLFLHGLTAGLCLWQMVNIFTLTTFSSPDFLIHYKKTSLPLQCVLYFLLSWCLVSACDRFDIGNPMPRFVMRAFTLQNGAVSIVFYLVALILNLITIKYEDKFYLYEEPASSSVNVTVQAVSIIPEIYVEDDEIETFRSLNSARCIFAVLGWFVLSITPNSDRLGKNLKSGETGLESELQMDGVSVA